MDCLSNIKKRCVRHATVCFTVRLYICAIMERTANYFTPACEIFSIKCSKRHDLDNDITHVVQCLYPYGIVNVCSYVEILTPAKIVGV